MNKKLLVVCFFLLLPCIAFAQDESITFTTYYPSPYGSYNEMRARRMAVGTTYVNDPNVCWENCPSFITAIDSDTNLVIEGNVGIGTVNPKARLDVAGGIRVGADTICNDQKVGTIRYVGAAPTHMEYCDGSGWKILGAGFPAPDWTSPGPWRNFVPFSHETLPHPLDTPPENLFVVIDTKLNGSWSSHWGISGAANAISNIMSGDGSGFGIFYYNLTNNNITIAMGEDPSGIISHYRVRIWKY